MPSGASGGVLRYALMVNTTETGGAADFLYIRLRKTDGTVLQEWMLDNTFSPKNQWMQNEVSLIDLNPYRGQALRLKVFGPR